MDEPLLQFFGPDLLQVCGLPYGVAMDYKSLADRIVQEAKKSAERTVALRKLIESQDAAMRAFNV